MASGNSPGGENLNPEGAENNSVAGAAQKTKYPSSSEGSVDSSSEFVPSGRESGDSSDESGDESGENETKGDGGGGGAGSEVPDHVKNGNEVARRVYIRYAKANNIQLGPVNDAKNDAKTPSRGRRGPGARKAECSPAKKPRKSTAGAARAPPPIFRGFS